MYKMSRQIIKILARNRELIFQAPRYSSEFVQKSFINLTSNKKMADILAGQTLVVDKEGTKVNAEEYLKGKVVALYVTFFKSYDSSHLCDLFES